MACEALLYVLPHVPPVELTVSPHGVHLEVNHAVLSPQTKVESYQPILGPSDLSRPLKSQEKSLWWWHVRPQVKACEATGKTKNMV